MLSRWPGYQWKQYRVIFLISEEGEELLQIECRLKEDHGCDESGGQVEQGDKASPAVANGTSAAETTSAETTHKKPSPTNHNHNYTVNNASSAAASCSHVYACRTPPHPNEWLQRPLLMVPSPGANITVRRIRRVTDPCYFDIVGDGESENNAVPQSQPPPEQPLQLPINNGTEPLGGAWATDFETPSFQGTVMVRIRNSNARRVGECRDTFGSGSEAAAGGDCGGDDYGDYDAENDRSNNAGYFAKYNRKYQMVVRGHFTRPDVPIAECVYGLALEHGLVTSSSDNHKKKKLASRHNNSSGSGSEVSYPVPPRWALRTAVKMATFFSPRMDADLEGEKPRMMSPLGMVAQTIHVHRGRKGTTLMDGNHTEPNPKSSSSLVADILLASNDNSHFGAIGVNNMNTCSAVDNHVGTGISTTRSNPHAVTHRKKAFNTAYNHSSGTKRASRNSSRRCGYFDPRAEYTFEFLQHLVDYNNLSLDLGGLLGNVKLGGALRGQPVRYVTAVKRGGSGGGGGGDKISGGGGASNGKTVEKKDDMDILWAFDLWHESLYTSV